MKDLVLFACPGLPETRVLRKYEEALPCAELRWIAVPGRSAVFTNIGQSCRGADGRVLPNLLAKYAPDKWRSVSLITYSAGYGLARELFREPADRSAILGYVAIDSIHAGFAASGDPSPLQLSPFVSYAIVAARGEALFVLGHTDVQTPQTGTGAFASTTQCARALAKSVPPTGTWMIRSYDLADAQHQMQEHGRALTAWGAPLVAETLAPWIAAWSAYATCEQEEPVPDTARNGSAPWLDPALSRGERAVLWSLHELKLGVCEEPPGSNTGPAIRRYLAPCERKGKRLGLTSGPWCAASACAAMVQTQLPGELPVHEYRASGIELEQDAKSTGIWTSKEVVGLFPPKRGDLAIYTRGGTWQRHVVRVETEPDTAGKWRSIGGNENDHWRLTERSLTDEGLLGFVRYP